MSSSLVEHVDVGGEKDDKEKDTDLPLVLMMGVMMVMVIMMMISQYNLCLSPPGLPLTDLVEHLLDLEAAPPHSLRTRFL